MKSIRVLPVISFAIFVSSLHAQTASRDSTKRQLIVDSFAASHQGYSVDEVIIDDARRDRFLDAAKQHGIDGTEAEILSALIRVRKSGRLGVKTTKRGRRIDEQVLPAAEIAIRVVTDRHRVSSDHVLIDPDLRDEFDREVQKVLPGVAGYDARKAALQLRKRRMLRPELVLRVADWQRQIKTYSLSELERDFLSNPLAELPGVYLFRHADQGYLYIGEAKRLGDRLATHLDKSDRRSLAEFLSQNDRSQITVEIHAFPTNSPAARVSVRRAYESELIRSRSPKFNVRP